MKKLLLVLPLLFAVSCSSVKLVVNTTTKDGERRMLTSNQDLFHTNDYDFQIALGARVDEDNDTIVGILITCDAERGGSGVFEEGDRLLIRLADQEKIELTNLLDHKYESYTETQVTDRVQTSYAYAYSPWGPWGYVTPYQVTSIVPQVYTDQINNSYALYLVTADQLKAIISKGVAKLRIETEDINVDMPYTENVAYQMEQLTRCLIEGFQNPATGADF